MTLIETLQNDMKEAMRSHDGVRRDVLRFLVSMLKNEALDKRKPLVNLSDDEVMTVLRRSVKQRGDSIQQYETGGRADLAEKESAEKSILESYLPAAPSEEVLYEAVRRAIQETGASTGKDIGKVIGAALRVIPGAPGSDIRRIASELLS